MKNSATNSQMKTPEQRISHRLVYDFQTCRPPDLVSLIQAINDRGYQLVSVTQDMFDRYTVFFRRPFNG